MIFKPRWMQGIKGDIAALVAGALMPLAYAPWSLWFLIFPLLLVLMLSWHQVSPRRALFRGWLFGLGMFGFGVSWIHVSMTLFGGVDPALSAVLTGVFVAFYALFPAVTGWLTRRFFVQYHPRPALIYIGLVPVFWLMLEWLRGLLFTGFPWLAVGYSQVDSVLSGFAPLTGVFGITYFVLLLTGLFAYALLSAAPEWKKIVPSVLLIFIIPALLKTIEWSDVVGEPFKVAIIQGNVSQDMKWKRDQLMPTLNLYADLSRENWDARLIVWPETAVPAFYHQIKDYLRVVAQEARMNQSELLVGLPVYDSHDKVYYNSMLSLGQYEKFYEKRHLVPFGEYLPLKDALGSVVDFLDVPMSNFASGRTEIPVLDVAGYSAGISICYEDVFGDEVIEALPRANFLVNASNDAWFGTSAAPHQHQDIARMRAIETSRYMVRATNTGVSAIIDHRGDILAQSPQFKLHVLTGLVEPRSGMTPYAVFGNVTILVIGIVLWFVFVVRHHNSVRRLS